MKGMGKIARDCISLAHDSDTGSQACQASDEVQGSVFGGLVGFGPLRWLLSTWVPGTQ